MYKLYLLAGIAGLICMAYFYGFNVGKSKCEINSAKQEINHINQNIENKKVINETVYKTGLGDIRRILRDKYSIAE